MTATKPPPVREPVVRQCAHCSCRFRADLDYEGQPHAPTRRYCSEDCKVAARNAHRRAVTAWEQQYEVLSVLHETERHGQLSLDERPLPELPPRPTRRG